MDILDLDRKSFELADGRKFLFVRYIAPKSLLVWEKNEWSNGEAQQDNKCQTCKGIDVNEVDVDVLKSLDVWDKLPVDIQSTIGTRVVQAVEETKEQMAKARACRKKKYENVPDELKCVKCDAEVKIPPSALAARVEKLGVLLVDYVKDFHCQKCRPSKGRRANPENAKIPKELTCKCGAIMKCSSSYIVQRAKLKGVTWEEIVNGYVCQKCNPTKGRNKKS